MRRHELDEHGRGTSTGGGSSDAGAVVSFDAGSAGAPPDLALTPPDFAHAIPDFSSHADLN